MNIPEAAVEAALSALFPNSSEVRGFARDVQEPIVRTILEAAAPFIAAQALDDAAEFVTSPRAKTTDANLARADAVRTWLSKRAATYRNAK